VSNTLSPEMLAQIFGQQGDDCFLVLLTLNHPSFAQTIRLVNNVEDIISNGNTYSAFPFKITLPADDGETAREVAIELDNASLELIEELRTVTDPIDVNLKMILGSIPDDIQMELDELKIGSIIYNKDRITGKMYQDNFMSTALTGEKYMPNNFPGLF
jgi:hypothetical protein